MANKRKINVNQPQVSLKRVKPYKQEKERPARTPYQRDPYGGRYGGNNFLGVVRPAHDYPYETIGATIGTLAANLSNKHNNKEQGQFGDQLRNDIYAELQNRYQADQNPFSAIQVPEVAVQSAEQADKGENMQMVQQAAEDAKQDARAVVASGNAPITAAGVNALGMNPKDERQFAVQRVHANEYGEWGDNPRQAQMQQKKIAEAATNMNSANLAGVSEDELYQLIDQLAAGKGKGMSDWRIRAEKEKYFNYFNQKRNNDTNALVDQSVFSYYSVTPQQRVEMRKQMENMAHVLQQKGFNDAAKALKAPIVEENMYQMQLQRKRDQYLWEKEQAMKDYLARKDIDSRYRVTGSRASSSNGISGTTSHRGSKAEKGQYELGKEMLKRKLQDNDILLKHTRQDDPNLANLVAVNDELVRQLENYDTNYKIAEQGMDYVNSAKTNDDRYNAVLRQARAWYDIGFSKEQIFGMIDRNFGDDAEWYKQNIQHDIFDNNLYRQR